MPVLGSGTYRLVPRALDALTGAWETIRGTSPDLTVEGTTDVDCIEEADYVAGSGSPASRLLFAGGFGVGPYDLTVLFEPNELWLDADVTPTTWAGLPPGFTTTAAVIEAKLAGTFDPNALVTLRFDLLHASDPIGPGGGTASPYTYAWPGPEPVPTLFFLPDTGCGVHVAFSAAPGPGLRVDRLFIRGTYDLVLYWWLLPSVSPCGDRQVSHLVLSPDSPGPDYVRLDPLDPDAAPTPTITLITPDHGDLTGDTGIEIAGEGFGDGATVTIDGVPCTDVVVVSQFLIRCTTPAHAAGLTDVVVTNPDGVTS